MPDNVNTQKSITNQIFDELFLELRGHEEFDAKTIEALRLLTQNGELKKKQKVIDVIKVLAEHKA